MLIQKRAYDDVKSRDSGYITPLHYLCANYDNYNLIDLVKLLIDKDADVNAKTETGDTPLNLLRKNYDNENTNDIVKLLDSK